MRSALALAAVLLVGCSDEPPFDASLLPIDERIEHLLGQMTLGEKVEQMHGLQLGAIADLFHTADNARLGIPGFRMVDGPRGVRAGSATCFPVGMARGATWDVALEERVGEAIGLETAARGGNVLLAPAINLLRHPGWGRAQETYGEDSHHIGAMGVAFIRGAQRHVIASAKHFALNSIEDTRFTVDVKVDERTLREVYLPHFERAVKDAGVGSVMSAYNLVNGAYCAENAHLLGDILKGEWGFDGFVESDWFFGTRSTVASALAGLDVEMPSALFYGPKLVAAVEGGEVPEAQIDDSVRRVLRKKLQHGLFAPEAVDEAVVESAEHTALAREVADEAMVLLTNEGGALPLPEGTTVALVGALADTPNLGDDGSSAVYPSYAVTPQAGLEARGVALEVIAADTLEAGDAARVAAAGAAVVVVGLTAADEGENLGIRGGDRDTLALSEAHQALIAEVAAHNDRTIVVVQGGSAITVEGWVEEVEAVLMAWYPGMEGGHALAAILFGDVNPSGKLPLSIPIDDGQLVAFDHVSSSVTYGFLHGYRHLDAEELVPRFAFGHGLSYTTFSYGALELSESVAAAGDVVTARVEVTNEGSRAGDEVVQVYVGAVESARLRAPRDLRGFARVTLAPGETKAVSIELLVRDLAYYDTEQGAWLVEPGAYTVWVGSSSARLESSAELRLE